MGYKEEMYKIKLKCGNCDKVAKYNIEKGTTIEEFLKNEVKNIECKRCECVGVLKKYVPPPPERNY